MPIRNPALRRLLNLKLYAMLLVDALLFAVSLVAAYFIRLDFDLSSRHWEQVRILLMFGIPAKLIIFALAGCYRGMWRYTSFRDIRRLLQASVIATLFSLAAVVYGHRFVKFSRAVFVIDALLTFILTAGLRVSIRMLFVSRAASRESWRWWFPIRARKHGRRVAIIGAGDAGARILGELENSGRVAYEVVCYLDDNPQKIGRLLHGVGIRGPIDRLARFVEDDRIEELFIAIPAASGEQMRRIVQHCEATGLPFRTLPTVGEILDGRIDLHSLRRVDYRDLLGRPAVILDTAGIGDYLKGRTVLVTGGGGSIGSELCRQIVRFQPGRLILFDMGEYNLYQVQMEFLHERRFHALVPILGAVQDRKLVERVFARYRPDVVFHAAAYKHVPLLERNPWEAITNNVLGSQVMMDVAARHGVDRFVLVSTDKAVRPANILGASKRVAEMVLQAQPEGATKFMAVRFGNVLDSAGSVVPLFRRQIDQGGPVTVTHPDVTRFFMTIPEASQLILQAGALGTSRDIFILEMGTPVRIADMARDLIRLHGREPDVDIPIVFTGLREGEKLYEELITQGEDILPTHHEKIRMLRATGDADLQTRQTLLAKHLDKLYGLVDSHDAVAIKNQFKEMVPEYNVQEAEAVL